METLKLGMILSFIPFTVIFLFLTAVWALVDIYLRKLSGAKKALWSAVVILFPLVGAIVYNFRVRVPDLVQCKTQPAN